MDFDRIDKKIEAKTGYRKYYERLGAASYILWANVIRKDDKVRKVEMKRVDLIVDSDMKGTISAYKSETLCPYGGSKCAVSLYSNEAEFFAKKVRQMKIRLKIDRIRTWYRKIFRRTKLQ